MPNVTVKYIINVLPGMTITQIRCNNTTHSKKMGEIPPPRNGKIENEITFFIGMEDYFEFRMNGVGDLASINTEGSYNFEYKGNKLMKKDAKFRVRTGGVIGEYKPVVKF